MTEEWQTFKPSIKLRVWKTIIKLFSCGSSKIADEQTYEQQIVTKWQWKYKNDYIPFEDIEFSYLLFELEWVNR